MVLVLLVSKGRLVPQDQLATRVIQVHPEQMDSLDRQGFKDQQDQLEVLDHKDLKDQKETLVAWVLLVNQDLVDQQDLLDQREILEGLDHLDQRGHWVNLDLQGRKEVQDFLE